MCSATESVGQEPASSDAHTSGSRSIEDRRKDREQ